MLRKKRKLYVWTDFCTDCSPGLAFAVASSLDEAIEKVKAECHPMAFGDYKYWGELHIHELNESVAYAVTGGS